MQEKKTFQELRNVIARLRDPKSGCPWDLEQTHESLKQYLIEECYEVLDAIDSKSTKLHEELGDVLLQVMLHSQIGKDEGRFDVDDVITAITNKLIVRHPHIFGEVQVSSSKEVLSNWEEIKKKDLKEGQSIIDGIPKAMPALLRAHRLGEKTARVGFDWDDSAGVREKVREELEEFLREEDIERMRDEFGDLLFTLAQLARKCGIDAEQALSQANDKFTRRFKSMETRTNKKLKELSRDELEALWNLSKADE